MGMGRGTRGPGLPGGIAGAASAALLWPPRLAWSQSAPQDAPRESESLTPAESDLPPPCHVRAAGDLEEATLSSPGPSFINWGSEWPLPPG